MLTIRQMERFWEAGDFGRLAGALLAGRGESVRTLLDCSQRVPAGAWAVIRIDEFGQSFHPMSQRLIRVLLGAQDADGGWGDAATTALVLRALSTSDGTGLAVQRGLGFLAMLQKESGLWPRIPIRRADGDEATTRAVLAHLAHVRGAELAVNLSAAHACVDRDPVVGKIRPVVSRQPGGRMAQLAG
jgi:hypothetical protein